MNEQKLRQIKLNMKYILEAAIAYETGTPIIDDVAYDSAVQLLQELKSDNEAEFNAALSDYPQFSDGTWTMTGNFWR